MTDKQRDVYPGLEVRYDDKGKLDEVVAERVDRFHLEYMDDGHVWIGFEVDGELYHVNLWRQGRRIEGRCEEA